MLLAGAAAARGRAVVAVVAAPAVATAPTSVALWARAAVAAAAVTAAASRALELSAGSAAELLLAEADVAQLGVVVVLSELGAVALALRDGLGDGRAVCAHPLALRSAVELRALGPAAAGEHGVAEGAASAAEVGASPLLVQSPLGGPTTLCAADHAGAVASLGAVAVEAGLGSVTVLGLGLGLGLGLSSFRSRVAGWTEADAAARGRGEGGEVAVGRGVGDVAPGLIGVVDDERSDRSFLPLLLLQLLHALLHVGAEAVVAGGGRVGHQGVTEVPPRLF
jgi:hypothetical protein